MNPQGLRQRELEFVRRLDFQGQLLNPVGHEYMGASCNRL